MGCHEKTIQDLKPIAPFSQGSTEVFLTGLWSNRKPVHIEKVSACREACPIGSDIARAFYHASKGEYDEALRIYRQENPLPGVCGRVCYHPCEMGCNRRSFDQAINVRGFERYLADHGKVDTAMEMPTQKRKEKVVVIGSGPAGLSAAYHTARLGYSVTILEALPEPGGMLMYGIPEYRLPKAVLRQEIAYIKGLGVDIVTHVRVGRDVTLAALRKEYDAIFVAVGAHAGIGLGMETGGSPGVVEGTTFLRNVALLKDVKPGTKVAVVGGGNTAIDCARTAKRMGAKDVTIIYRRSRNEMPALAEDVDAAAKEGIKITLQAVPKRFITTDGRITAMECLRIELGSPDWRGRPAPLPVQGSEFVIPVDTIIAAIGQTPENDLTGEAGLQWNEKGIIETSATAITSLDGVFAGGDASGTKAYVADAIAGGKMGALAIFCYLTANDTAKEFDQHRISTSSAFSFRHLTGPEKCNEDIKRVVSYDKVNTLCFPYGAREANPEVISPQGIIEGFKETVGGLDEAAMKIEINRCFKCGICTNCDLCFLLCPDVSLVKEKNGYGVRVDYCKGCSVCAASCPRNVIEMEGAR